MQVEPGTRRHPHWPARTSWPATAARLKARFHVSRSGTEHSHQHSYCPPDTIVALAAHHTTGHRGSDVDWRVAFVGSQTLSALTGVGFTTSESSASSTIRDQLLMARRLVEAGALRRDRRLRLLGHARPELPLPAPAPAAVRPGHLALVEDIYVRGLDRDVTVVVWGEFGRTPKINKDAGRDHWARVNSALLSGGGMKAGQVIGSTDKLGGSAASHPVHYHDVLATIYHNLGIDPHAFVRDKADRPVNTSLPPYRSASSSARTRGAIRGRNDRLLPAAGTIAVATAPGHRLLASAVKRFRRRAPLNAPVATPHNNDARGITKRRDPGGRDGPALRGSLRLSDWRVWGHVFSWICAVFGVGACGSVRAGARGFRWLVRVGG